MLIKSLCKIITIIFSHSKYKDSQYNLSVVDPFI